MRKITATLSILVLLSMLVGVAWAQAPDSDVQVDLTLGGPPASVVAAPGGGSVPAGGSPLTVLDDFNRADGPLGPDWSTFTGSCSIVSQAARCGYGVAAYVGAGGGDGSTAEVDVQTNGTPLQYVGVVLHAVNGGAYPFLKVQDQSGDGRFEYGACYLGNNGGMGSFGLGFYPLDQSFASAHMKATQEGTTVTIEFTNVDGGTLPDQTYVCTGAPAPAGSMAGINGYAMIAQVDNYAVGGVDLVFATHVRIIPLGAPSLLLGVVRAATGDGATPVPGATVDVTWTLPIGGGYVIPQSRVTNANGLAFPVMILPVSGTYVLDLVNITAAGYEYDPDMNFEDQATYTKP